MNRYKNTPVIRNTQNGALTAPHYRQTRSVAPPPTERDTYFYSREGDRLDSLANEFYKDVTLWWVIAAANNLGKGSFTVSAGKLMRIPFQPYTIA
jgi:nucleoid-associated protein YgaU